MYTCMYVLSYCTIYVSVTFKWTFSSLLFSFFSLEFIFGPLAWVAHQHLHTLLWFFLGLSNLRMLIFSSISGSSAHETLTIFHQKEMPGGCTKTKLEMHLLLFFFCFVFLLKTLLQHNCSQLPAEGALYALTGQQRRKTISFISFF